MGFFSKLFGKKDKKKEEKCNCGCEDKKAAPAATPRAAAAAPAAKGQYPADAPHAGAAAAKSLQSCPTLCDPTDGSPPGSPVPGFSRQERWSGLPFPSPMHESEK